MINVSWPAICFHISARCVWWRPRRSGWGGVIIKRKTDPALFSERSGYQRWRSIGPLKMRRLDPVNPPEPAS